MRLLKHRVLRKIFGFTKDEVTGGLIRLHVFCTAHRILLGRGGEKSRRMRRAWHAARIVERRGVYRVLVGKPDGKSPLRRPKRRWESNTKIDIKEGLGTRTGLLWLMIGMGGRLL